MAIERRNEEKGTPFSLMRRLYRRKKVTTPPSGPTERSIALFRYRKA